MWLRAAPIVLFGFIGGSLAVPTPSSRRHVLERRSRFPRDWTQIGRPDPNELIQVHVGLRQKNLHNLESTSSLPLPPLEDLLTFSLP